MVQYQVIGDPFNVRPSLEPTAAAWLWRSKRANAPPSPNPYLPSITFAVRTPIPMKTRRLFFLVLASLTLITAACMRKSSQVTASPASEAERPAPPANRPTPKNWPWRGICFPSAHADYTDVAYLNSIGVNFLRIQLKSPKRAKRDNIDPTKAFYAELEWADKVLDECKKYNMTALIAFNYLVLDPNSPVDDKKEDFWKKPQYTDSVYNMVDIIAKRYKDRGDELSAYEVIGEPTIEQKGDAATTPPQLETFYSKVLTHIRKYDQQRWFLLSPGPWGKPTNYKGFNGFKIYDNKLIYGAHMYLPNPYALQGIRERDKGLKYPGMFNNRFWDKSVIHQSFKAIKDFGDEHNALIYIGEFQAVRWAPGALQWVKDVADEVDADNFGWSYFAYKPDMDFWDPFYEVANPNDPPTKWTLKNTGPTTDVWKEMMRRFAKNKK